MEELRLNIPKRMIDLTEKQLLYVSRLFLSELSEVEFLLKAFMHISGLKLVSHLPADYGARWYMHKSLKNPILIDPDKLVVMSDSCRFLLNPSEIIPVKWIRMARARQFRLYNACFEEYLMAENYYFAYAETRDSAHLDNLISVLYRRPGQRWRSSEIQKRALYFRNVDAILKNTVFMWYIGFRTYIPKRCETLFSGTKKGQSFSPRNYINGMVHQLTNGDITIKNRLLKTPAWDALDELEQRALENKQIISKTKKR